MLDFKTRSNSSQFINLENLIGSIHKNAPASAQIYVQDMGLTEGQKILLKLYQNVQIISSNNINLQKTRLIEVDNEFVIIDGKYKIRSNSNKLLYIDAIRKQINLAIVIPFIRSQLLNVKKQLNLSELYTPCRNHFEFIDLIFYHNEGRDSFLETELRRFRFTNKCFRNIRYLSVKLTEREEKYPFGSFFMWQKLLLEEHASNVSLRAYGYTHFFFMEPDTRPIREYWLDAIVDQITNNQNPHRLYYSTDWWISGSIYRGSKPIGLDFLHINGNALYHLTASFLADLQNLFRIHENDYLIGLGYDLAIFRIMIENHDLAKRLWHKFRFSDFIQNCWHTDCDFSDQFNNTQFILNNPYTYFIHGNLIHEKTTDQKSNYLLKIILISMLVISIFLYRRRRLRMMNCFHIQKFRFMFGKSTR